MLYIQIKCYIYGEQLTQEIISPLLWNHLRPPCPSLSTATDERSLHFMENRQTSIFASAWRVAAPSDLPPAPSKESAIVSETDQVGCPGKKQASVAMHLKYTHSGTERILTCNEEADALTSRFLIPTLPLKKTNKQKYTDKHPKNQFKKKNTKNKYIKEKNYPT